MSSIVAFAAHGASDPSVRTRVIEWCRRTNCHWELRVGGALGPRRTIPKNRTVLVARYAYKCSTGAFEERVLGDAALGVYDLDDGLPWDDGRLPGLGAWWKRPFRRDRIAIRAATAATRVIAGNEVLADWASQHCRDVRLIPTCVDLADYEEKQTYAIGDEARVLWIGTSATENELDLASDALVALHRRTNCRLTILGSAATKTSSKLLPFTMRVPWSLERQRIELAQSDVGIMPLRDGRYQGAKCGYKLLQYAAAGLPSVCSPVGVNAQLVERGLALGARSIDEWLENLTGLLEASSSERALLGKRARSVVATHYTYDMWRDRWIDAVSE